MTKKAQRSKPAADKVAKNILRKNWHSYSSEEKIRIVLAGLRAKKVSQFCAVARGSQRACFTVGRRNFLRQEKPMVSPKQIQPALPVRPVWQAGCRSEGRRMRGPQRWIKLVCYHAVADNIFILFGYPAKRQLWIALFYFECEIPKNLRRAAVVNGCKAL